MHSGLFTSEPTEQQQQPQQQHPSNGAGSPALRCVATKTVDENDNALVVDAPGGSGNLELIELTIAVDDDDSDGSSGSGLGVCIKGMSAGQEDLGLFVKRIIDGRAAAKVGRRLSFLPFLSCYCCYLFHDFTTMTTSWH